MRPETTDLNGSGKRDLMWQRQEDLHGRAGGDLLRKEEVDPAELTSRDSVEASPIADPLVHRTIIGSRI